MEILLIRTLIGAMRLALEAVIRANHVAEADQRNLELDNLGSNLIVMGVISAASTILALVQVLDKIIAYPFYLHVFLLAILGLIAVSGLTGITYGMHLLAINNPTRHLAAMILWISCVGAAFATGILLVSSLRLKLHQSIPLFIDGARRPLLAGSLLIYGFSIHSIENKTNKIDSIMRP